MSRIDELLERRLRAITADRDLIDHNEEWSAENETSHQKHMADIKRFSDLIDAEKANIKAEDEATEARAKFDEVLKPREIKTDVDPTWASKEGFNAAIRSMLAQPGGEPLHVPYINGDIRLPHYGEKRTDYPLILAGTTTSSNYLVPTLLWQDLVYHMNAQSGVLKAGPTIIRTAGMGTIDVPVLLTDPVATQGAEATADSNAVYPVFSKVSMKAFRIGGFMSFTEEMARSSDFPIYDVLSQVAGRSLAAKAASDYCLGAGSTYADGLFIAAAADCSANVVTAAATDTFTMDELLSVFYTLNPAYRAVGSWVVSSPAMKVIARTKDDNGNYLWAPTVIAGEPDRLWGRPIFEDAYADANGVIATGEEHIVFGDMSKFWIRYSGGIDISASRDMKFNEWEIVVRFALWHDCNIVDIQAFSLLTQG
jgi:HK97 family phage major capsid protein